MRVTGLMIRQMEKGFTLIWMEQDTKESGKWISNMVKGRKYGQIMHHMKEIIYMERSMARESLSGQMVLHTMENLKKIILKE